MNAMTKSLPIPEAARAAGMTRLVFADDFDSYDTIDLSGKGRPGYLWYADRPYGFPTLTREELVLRDSVLHMEPEVCGSAIGLCSFSRAGACGFAMHYGYAEARIRASMPTGPYNGVPAFWGISQRDFMDGVWEHCGELDILEINVAGDGMIYTGTLHDHYRSGRTRPDGTREQTAATNLVNALGYGRADFLDDGWHTYAALWEPGHVAWYLDGVEMHSARYRVGALPEYYYRDDPRPLPRIEASKPELAGRTWPGAHHIMEMENEVIILGCNKHWPMDVDWVRIWQA